MRAVGKLLGERRSRTRRAAGHQRLGVDVLDGAELGPLAGGWSSSISSRVRGYQPSSTSLLPGVNRWVISSAVRSSAGMSASAARDRASSRAP